MLVLTWNLFHGRSVPETPHSLLPEFAALLASWEWDVALLQEVLPWWPVELGRASHASARMALTSRNASEERGAALSSSARSSRACRSSRESSSPVSR